MWSYFANYHEVRMSADVVPERLLFAIEFITGSTIQGPQKCSSKYSEPAAELCNAAAHRTIRRAVRRVSISHE
jgi:hypothetical protein